MQVRVSAVRKVNSGWEHHWQSHSRHQRPHRTVLFPLSDTSGASSDSEMFSLALRVGREREIAFTRVKRDFFFLPRSEPPSIKQETDFGFALTQSTGRGLYTETRQRIGNSLKRVFPKCTCDEFQI